MNSASYGPPLDDDFEEDEFMFEDEQDEEHDYSDQPRITRSYGSTNITPCVNRFGLPNSHRGGSAGTAGYNEHIRDKNSGNRRKTGKTTVKVSNGNMVLPVEDVKMAAMHNNVALLKRCLEQGFAVDTPINSDWTAIMYAAHYGHNETVDCLLEAGANAKYHKDQYTVLMAACSSTSKDEDDIIKCVEGLVKAGADVNAYDRHHVSPIIYAAREGRAKLIKRLFELGSDVNKHDSRGFTALMWAVTKKKLNAVYTLIELGCDVDKRNRYGATALDIATIDGHKLIEQLLRNKSSSTSDKLIFTESELNAAQDNKSACDSGDATMHYGDLEMVLSGLGYSDLIRIFHKNNITLEQFLRMTDSDLQPIVPQAGIRKKLLDNISKLHKKEWEVTSLSTTGALRTNQLSCAEAIFMMQNIKKHASYIASTAAYIKDNMSAHVLSAAQEGAAAPQLLIHTTEACTNTKLLYDELNALTSHLQHMTSQPAAQPPDLIQNFKAENNTKSGRRWFAIGIGLGVVGVALYKHLY